MTATYVDPNPGDAQTATIAWGDGAVTSAAAGNGSVSGSHSYTNAGVYTVEVTVTDDAGESDVRSSVLDEPAYVVIYDPGGGRVTGGGWMDSAPDACPDFCDGASGRATFGFVARYRDGEVTPSGNLQLRLNAGGLAFRATTFDWLVVDGSVARLAGSGDLDDLGACDFVLTAGDQGAVEPGLRLRLVEHATGTLVYDNRIDAAPTTLATTPLGGGSIGVHAR